MDVFRIDDVIGTNCHKKIKMADIDAKRVVLCVRNEAPIFLILWEFQMI